MGYIRIQKLQVLFLLILGHYTIGHAKCGPMLVVGVDFLLCAAFLFTHAPIL
jgi:hypothetical protein